MDDIGKLKKAEFVGPLRLTIDGHEVDAHCRRPKEFTGKYYATYRHPVTGWGLVTQVDASQVYAAIDRMSQ